MSKKCARCGKILPNSSFNWKIKNIRLATYCKQCSREYIRNHYENNRDYYIEKATKRNKIQMELTHQFLGNYLQAHPCIDCGERDVLVLEFDHKERTEKYDDIASIVRRRLPLRSLKKEIEKCEIRCANCHRRKTEIENKSWKINYRASSSED